MKSYISLLEKIKLFDEISEEDIITMLTCLNAKIDNYKKGQFILMAGTKVENIGIVLEGQAHIIKESMEGERIIISVLDKGDYFAEALCCAVVEASPVSVQAINDTKIMFLNFSRILHTCPNSCLFHTKLIENMLFVLASKNLTLQNRMDIITQKTLRLKVLSYLNFLSDKQGNKIIIPFNREGLADFLCVDRSSLSHELSRMKEDGLIEFYKNKFEIL
ncbi:MAG: Crp/Fnr family transcriptional regulator [Clostridiales bacterium]|nr:Crp/Fnr family transcriptional regulator [Clostridiales bacterium]